MEFGYSAYPRVRENAGKRSREPLILIDYCGITKSRVVSQVAVAADDQGMYLRFDPVDDIGDKGLFVPAKEPLVPPVHALTLSAGQDNCSHL